jgi:hypothetical protein
MSVEIVVGLGVGVAVEVGMGVAVAVGIAVGVAAAVGVGVKIPSWPRYRRRTGRCLWTRLAAHRDKGSRGILVVVLSRNPALGAHASSDMDFIDSAVI